MENGEFQKLSEVISENIQIEAFIDKKLLNQYTRDNIVIDAKTWKFHNWKRSTLFLHNKN